MLTASPVSGNNRNLDFHTLIKSLTHSQPSKIITICPITSLHHEPNPRNPQLSSTPSPDARIGSLSTRCVVQPPHIRACASATARRYPGQSSTALWDTAGSVALLSSLESYRVVAICKQKTDVVACPRPRRDLSHMLKTERHASPFGADWPTAHSCGRRQHHTTPWLAPNI